MKTVVDYDFHKPFLPLFDDLFLVVTDESISEQIVSRFVCMYVYVVMYMSGV